nr:hypothetical protein [Tanacetum cinerariifolium]
MDSIIPLRQKNTLVEFMILSSADNHPPMLDKDLEWYDQNKKYAELFASEKIQADCDMKATNIILQGLPADIYSLMNHHRERECKLYDAFDKFTYIKEETLHKYYLRFTQLINDMNIYNMRIEQFQVNTKFLNNLPLEWSKFVTVVNLMKDLHITNFDQLHAYLEQHELHANEVHLLRKRNQDPLAFMSQMNHQTSSIPQIAYQSPRASTQPLIESPLVDSGFAVPIFSPGDDLIACVNKAMAFLTVVASSRFPSTNNQLRTSLNLRNHATIQDGTVTVQQVQGRQAWYKEKAILAKAQEAGQILDEEQLTFLADLGVPDGQAVQTIIPNNAAFQTKDLNTYDFDCDDISNAQAVLMANISNYGSNVILEVPHFKTYLNVMENQSVHTMQDFELTPAVGVSDNEIHSDSNIIPYSYYLEETQQENVQDTHLQAQQDSMILSVKEQIREKMIDSQMDDMIKEKLALKEQVDSLEQNLSKQIKENECLLQTFTAFKRESKEKEAKNIENKIDLEKKIKEFYNIIFKVGQSAHT